MEHQRHLRAGSLGLGVSSSSSPPGPTDEIVVALGKWGHGRPPAREELVRALTAAGEGIKDSGGGGSKEGAIPMDVEMDGAEGEDELDRPSSAWLSGASAHWVLRCRLVNNAVSVLDQLAASNHTTTTAHATPTSSSPRLLDSARRRSSSGTGNRAAVAMPFTPNSTGGSSGASGRRRDSSLGGKEVNVSLDIDSGAGAADKGKDAEELRRLQEENEMLRHRLAEVEGNWRKAVDSAKGLQSNQQRLFQDLVLLREKYDDAKAHIAEVLWSYLPAESRFCPSIPPLARGLFESEKRVGDWELGEKLGEGQFAKVFACRGPRRDKDYALKVINKDKINSLAALKRVDSEVGAQRTLRHRGILQVKEVLNGRYGLYVIMEMGGKDLFDFVEEQQQAHAPATAAGADSDSDDEEDESTPTPLQRGIVVSEANCRVLARNLVDAIAFCHANGIAHRDLKPENILLASPRGQPVANPDDPALFEAKLCDFGLCSSFTPGQPLTDFCGSPGFFAPEMITVGSYDGPAADIWSLGCILLELSVGHDLFCEEWMQAYDYDLMQDAPRFEARLQECRAAIEATMREKLQLSEHLTDFILGLLAVDPAQRLTVPQIVAHPWIALGTSSPQGFLTGVLPPSPKEVEQELQAQAQGRAETPLPATASKRPGPLLSLKGGIPEEGAEDASPLMGEEDEGEGEEMKESDGSSDDDSDAMRVSMSPPKPAKKPAALRASMSQKLRSKLEPKGIMQLPPQEPPTPAVTAAKQLLGIASPVGEAGGQQHASGGPPPGF